MQKTLLTLPPELLGEVQEISGAPTKSKAVVIAMEEYLRDKKVNQLLNRIGKGFGMSLHRLNKIRSQE